MKVGDDLYPDDPNSLCFGCGHHTPTAFCLRSSTPVGHRADAKCEAPARMCGAPNVVHGGSRPRYSTQQTTCSRLRKRVGFDSNRRIPKSLRKRRKGLTLASLVEHSRMGVGYGGEEDEVDERKGDHEKSDEEKNGQENG